MKDIMSRRRGPVERVIFAIAFATFFIYSLSMILTILWAVLSSLKANREFFSSTFSLPKEWLFTNYIDAFQALRYRDTNFLGMIFNSIWLTVGRIFLGLMSSSLTGYIFSKFNFKLKNFMFSIVIFSIIVPILSSGAAGYKLIYDLGLNDSPLYLVTAMGGFGMTFIIMQSVYKNISWSYAEAAYIDGAGHLYTYLKVMMPMAMPVMFALSITSFISGWNDYMTSLMYLENFPTLAAGLYFYRSELQYASNEPLYFAGAIMSALPVFATFIIFQSKVFERVSVGGLKG